MIELTLEQSRAVALANGLAGRAPVDLKVIDPATKRTYALVPVESEGLEQEPPLETPAPPWQHLVVRDHPWRKQLYIKGRNMTVRHLIGSMKANRQSEEEAAKDWRVPVEAIREAIEYFEANPEVIALDHATEMFLLASEEKQGHGPKPVPR